MLKLMVGKTELTPVGLGAQETTPDGVNTVVVVDFNTTLSLPEVLKIFKSLDDDDVISIQNEKNTLAFSEYVCMDEKVLIKEKSDGSFDYSVTMHKKDAYAISKENTKSIKDLQASVDYLAVLADVDIDDTTTSNE